MRMQPISLYSEKWTSFESHVITGLETYANKQNGDVPVLHSAIYIFFDLFRSYGSVFSHWEMMIVLMNLAPVTN